MGFMNNIVQGMLGNLSEVTPEALQKDYGAYLMEGETIQTGFILIRNVVIFTNARIIDFDKQGATGKKAIVTSVYLDSIINVSLETAGFGFDDSSLDIEYITSPYFRSTAGITTASRRFEFPKKYQIQPLYTWLQDTAYKNHLHINR